MCLGVFGRVLRLRRFMLEAIERSFVCFRGLWVLFGRLGRLFGGDLGHDFGRKFSKIFKCSEMYQNRSGMVLVYVCGHFGAFLGIGRCICAPLCDSGVAEALMDLRGDEGRGGCTPPRGRGGFP